MATFDNTIPLSYETSLLPVGSRDLVISQDLTWHIESFTDDEFIDNGLIVCRPLTSAQVTTVMNFYTTNKNLSFDFVDPNDGETYALRFVGNPSKPVKIPSMIGHWEIRLNVVGVKV